MNARWILRRVFLCLLPLAGSISAAAPAPSGKPVTFARDIAPIVYQNCSPCHRPGESAPFSLLSYEDARRHASQIADVTKRRFMPPWLPEPGHLQFEEERRLTSREIQLIQDWVAQGSPEGPPKHVPPSPHFSSEWQLGKPDLILHVQKPYPLPANSSEIFWNFILPVPISKTRWVRAMAVRPGNPIVFHHANVIIDRSGSAKRQEKTAGIGFPGMDLSVEESTFDPDGHFLSWKPGSAPVVEPKGMAWRAEPGMDLVLNVHLRPTGKPETIDPEIGLYFTDEPQTKFPMLVQLEHDGAIDIPPGDKDFLVSDDFKCPLDLDLLAIYPHAHYLATLMEGYATLPDGSRKWIVRIPDWDLNWQGVYKLKEPLFLPKGTVVSMRYHYDNSAGNVRNPNHPPIEVRNGLRSTDEMGHLWLQVLPTAPGDQREILQAAIAQERIQKYPQDFSANYSMGDLMLGRGNAVEAASYFAVATRANPDSVVAATELGIALFTQGKTADAADQFAKALAIDAKYTDARFDLASAQAETGDLAGSVKNFREVLAERPDYPKAADHLGDVLFALGDQLAKAGDNALAIAAYRDALVYRTSDVELRTSLGAALARSGMRTEARQELQSALQLNPNFEPAQKLLTALQ